MIEITARLYKNSKGLIINLSGDVEEIKLDHRQKMVVELSENGREIRLKPWADVEL
jgi:hypothetical protein